MEWQMEVLWITEAIFLGMGTYFDIKEKELPMSLFFIFGAAGSVYQVLWKVYSIRELLYGVCVGGFFLLVGWLSREAIGYGDGLGLMVMGVYEGWRGMIPIIFGAFCFSSIYGIWRLIGYQDLKTDTMPFFPFLFLSFIGVSLL